MMCGLAGDVFLVVVGRGRDQSAGAVTSGLAPSWAGYPVQVHAASIDVYVGAVVARWDAIRRAGQREVDEPGVRGLLPCADDARIRLLVTDDRAYQVLARLLPDARAGMISVFEAATRCTGLLDAHSAWKAESVTAMIYRDLEAVPAITMPSDLEVRPVTRLDEAVPGAVDLEEAAATAIRADPRITESPDSFVDFLRSLPSETRLFAAADSNGVVRATSGFIAFGKEANVFFINTDQAWRGRGIGSAMTAAALRAAKDRGLRQASMDATNAGISIYLRLGFEVVGEARRFRRIA